MSNGNIELALRIKADLTQAVDSVKTLKEETRETSQEFKALNTSAGGAVEAVDKIKQMSDDSADALEQQRAAVAKLLGDIDPLERKLSRLDELEEQLNKTFKSGAIDAEIYSESLSKLNKQRDALGSFGADKQQDSISKLLGTIDPLEKKLASLDDLEQQLTNAFKDGRIESERYNSALKTLNAQRDKAVNSAAKVVTVNEKSNKALKTSSRELSIISRQLMSGGFGSASSGIINIAQRAGALPAILSGASLAISGVVAAGAGLYNIVKNINHEQDTLNRSIAITGSYSGVTAGQINVMAASLKSTYGTIAANRDIFAALNETGQFTGKTLESVGGAAVALSDLTGKAANDSVNFFARMKNGVTDWALEANKQYHFLDLATYQRISALEKQGRIEEAIELASQRFSTDARQRVNELTQEINWLNSALNSTSSAWEQMKVNASNNTKSLLNLETDEDTLARYKRLQQMQTEVNQQIGVAGDTARYFGHFTESDKEELQRLEKIVQAKQDEAAEAAKVQQAQEKAIKAQKALNDVHDQQKTDIEKQNEAIQRLIKSYQDLWATAEGREQLQSAGVSSDDGKVFQGGQYDKDVSTVKEQNPDKLNQQYEQRLEQLKQEQALSGQATRASRVRYETEHGGLKKLSAEQKKTLVQQAELADRSAKAFKSSQQSIKASAQENQRYIDQLTKKALKETETAATVRRQEINARNLTEAQRAQALAAHDALIEHENIKKNLELQVNLLKQQGKVGAAGALEIEDSYSRLFKELEAQSNSAGLALAKMSKQIELDKLPVVDAQQQIERMQAAQSRREQLIQAQQQAGYLSRYEASKQLLEIERETRFELEKKIPTLEYAAEKTGDPAIIERLAAVRHEIQLLSIESNEWVTTLQDGVESGLNSAFNGLITRSHDLSSALTAIAQSIVMSFANMASQNLSSVISNGIGNLFGGAGEESTEAAAGAMQYSTAITTASATGAGTLTSALTAAFSTGALTLANAITAASAGNAGVGAAASVMAASGGLIRGPGTGTSDSIPSYLSNFEYVIKAASVKKYGVGFLNAVNRGKLPRLGFSEGGLVSAPMLPSMSGQFSAPDMVGIMQPQQPNITNEINQTLVFDAADAVEKGINSARGNRSLMTFFSANASKINSILGN